MSIPVPPKTGNIALDEYLQWTYIILKNEGYTQPITNGSLLVGKSNGEFTTTTLTAGAGVTILNGDGTITISSP